MNIMMVVLLLFCNCSLYAAFEPTFIMDTKPDDNKLSAGFAPVIKYRHITGPENFGGDMGLFGVRAFCGQLGDPEFGIFHVSGDMDGNALEFSLDMTGATIEDSFASDHRFKWRISAGVGKYRLRTISGKLSKGDGTYGFFEPMILGVLPMSRHIVLEFGLGYTFADVPGFEFNGIAINAELVIGSF